MSRRALVCLLFVIFLIGTTAEPVCADELIAVEPQTTYRMVATPVHVPAVILAQLAKKEVKKTPWYRSSRGRWWLIGGGIVAVLVVIIVVYLMAAEKKRKGPKLLVTENQVGGYRLQSLLATGHTSQVWEVVELVSHRHFAMKFLLPENVHNSDHRQLLFHEAEVGRILAHPNIIKITHVVKDKEHPFFIMEFFPSGSLKLRIMRKEKEFLQEKVHDIFKQAMTGLAYMHASGWVHRDIKPENILVNSAGEVRIIDFAITQRIPKGMSKTFHRRAGSVQGTRSYMSPEQIRGQALDGRADMYSFGAAAYEVVTGRPPFRAGTPEDLLNKHLFEKPPSPVVFNPDITKEFAEFLLRLLSKRREERPNNFHEALMQFRNMKVFKTPTAKKEEAK
jgi:eukaryotic-like serine/threonine-protein kinase